jgi:hypothetical protein
MPWDEDESILPTVPLIPDHEYDFPPDPHVGHAAALNVPCSEGPPDCILDRPLVSDRFLIEFGSPIEPGRQMEAGVDDDLETRARLAQLFLPVRPQYLHAEAASAR